MELDKKANTKLATLIGIGLVGLVLLFVAVNSVHVIPTGERAAVRQFGVVVEQLNPGLHFRLMGIFTIDRYDVLVRPMPLEFSAHTTDAQTVNGNISIHFQLNDWAIEAIAEEYGLLPRLEGMLEHELRQATQNVFAGRSAMRLVQERGSLAPDIQRALDDVAQRFHVTITTVALVDMSFGAEFERSIEQVAIADQARIQAELEAARRLIQAENELDVQRRVAEGEIVRAEADARALQIMQEAWGDLGLEVREVMLRQQAINNWDGVLPNVIGGGDFSLILDNFQQSSPVGTAPATGGY